MSSNRGCCWQRPCCRCPCWCAAIDELVARLARDGVWTRAGNRRQPAMVRLGRMEVTHAEVRDFHVDAVAARLLPSHQGSQQAGAAHETAMKRQEVLRQDLQRLQQELNTLSSTAATNETMRAAAATGGGAGADGGEGGECGSDDMDFAVADDSEFDGDGGEARAGGRRGRDGDANGARPEGLPSEASDHEALRNVRYQMRKKRAELEEVCREARGGRKVLEHAKRELRQAVIRAAEVVVCTLSAAAGEMVGVQWLAPVAIVGKAHTASHSSRNGAGLPPLPTGHGRPAVATGAQVVATGPGGAPLFDALVIDEAAQALEPATLIPFTLLKPGAKVVLVGDSCQLPPTVLSRAATKAGLSQSLFVRLQQCKVPVTMLAEQYRMHPAIARWAAMARLFFYFLVYTKRLVSTNKNKKKRR